MSILKFLRLPENFSQHGEQVDHMNAVVHWLALILFIGWTSYFVIVLYKFWHKRNPVPSYSGVKNHVTTHLEIGVVIIEAIFLLGCAFPLWADRTDTFDRILANDPDAPRVRVIGQQYRWTNHYPGNDGIFGRTDNTLISGDNSLGQDPSDPNGDDDFTSTTMLRLPVNRDCILQVTSKDVIHNFAIVPMRIQQDCIPGKEVPMWFKPIKEMETYVVCAQLCGESHANMKGNMEVINADEYYAWAKSRSDEELAKKKK